MKGANGHRKQKVSWGWWCTPVTLVLGRQRQENQRFKVFSNISSMKGKGSTSHLRSSIATGLIFLEKAHRSSEHGWPGHLCGLGVLE